jgi:hypothetical protein
MLPGRHTCARVTPASITLQPVEVEILPNGSEGRRIGQNN